MLGLQGGDTHCRRKNQTGQFCAHIAPYLINGAPQTGAVQVTEVLTESVRLCSKAEEKGLKFAGKGSFQFKGFAGDGVREREPGGMEEIAIEPEALGLGIATRGAGGSSLCGNLISELRRGAVESIADDGMADGGHVDANLVGTARFDADADQGELAEARVEAANDFVVRDGGTGVFGRAGGHAGAAHRIAADGSGDGSLLALDCALHECDIGLADLTRGKKFGERGVGGVVFGDDDEAAGVLVEAMDNAGPEVAAGCRKRFESKEQRIDEGVAVARIFSFAGAGVHHHAGGLVDDGEVLVFEDDVERNVLRRGFERCGMGFAGDEYLFSAAKLERRLGLRSR